ncbi:MAG: MarR family winged helix-turn-helix transcriptional regulator [Bradyrhizobium sp.]|uniref:MarR family winged helix-turn-helix transcriptional regulator n=1 Tax=Bradyrhizobium sp. TaxID=376 RepID=UPI003D10AB39
MTTSRKTSATLADQDYVALADFRYVLRKFMAFSEAEAAEHGLTPQQHQALLAIRAAPMDGATVGYVAERLLLKPHSATGLVNRLEVTGLVERTPAQHDRRCSTLTVSVKGRRCLDALSATHREEIKRLRPVLSQLVDRIQDNPSA